VRRFTLTTGNGWRNFKCPAQARWTRAKAMPSTNAAIEDEKKAFIARLPDMLREHSGEFAVFKGGVPVGFFVDMTQAYQFAIDKYGPEGGFLIREVAPERLEVASLTWHFGVTHVR
jgi:hypothetical protein